MAAGERKASPGALWRVECRPLVYTCSTYFLLLKPGQIAGVGSRALVYVYIRCTILPQQPGQGTEEQFFLWKQAACVSLEVEHTYQGSFFSHVPVFSIYLLVLPSAPTSILLRAA